MPMEISDAIDVVEFENAGRQIVLTLEPSGTDKMVRLYIDEELITNYSIDTDSVEDIEKSMEVFFGWVNKRLYGETIEIPEKWVEIVAAFRAWTYDPVTFQMVKG